MRISANKKTDYYSSRIYSSAKSCDHQFRQGSSVQPKNNNKTNHYFHVAVETHHDAESAASMLCPFFPERFRKADSKSPANASLSSGK